MNESRTKSELLNMPNHCFNRACANKPGEGTFALLIVNQSGKEFTLYGCRPCCESLQAGLQ